MSESGTLLLFAAVQKYGRFLGYSGREILAVSLSGFDPKRKSQVQRDSRNGTYGISRLLFSDHSGFAPENLITLAHFSVSSAMSLPKSAEEPGSTVPPRSANRAFSLGSARPALISALSFPTISDGAFVGALRPTHWLASKPGTKSPTVGISGSASERVAVVTANARSLPALMYST